VIVGLSLADPPKPQKKQKKGEKRQIKTKGGREGTREMGVPDILGICTIIIGEKKNK